jgi:hypothetical protein
MGPVSTALLLVVLWACPDRFLVVPLMPPQYVASLSPLPRTDTECRMHGGHSIWFIGWREANCVIVRHPFVQIGEK